MVILSPPVRVSALCSLLMLALTAEAHAAGLSARFGHVRAVEGEPLVVRVEVEDPSCALAPESCLLQAVSGVVVELRTRGEERWREAAARHEGAGWWAATFTSTAIPSVAAGARPPVLELRARVVGARGGTLAALGDDEPLEVEVQSQPEARRLERIVSMRARREPDELELLGYVGAEGRVMSSSRVRAWVGVGARLTERSELIAAAAVGPAFARPGGLGGGPVTLGAELALRLYTLDPKEHRLTLFLEPALACDLRFPGLDPSAGARAGLTLRVSADVAVDVALGGAATLFDVTGDPFLSAAASLRTVLRIGGRRE